MSDDKSPASDAKPKFGATHVAAMGRLGLAELRAALFTDSNVAKEGEMGLYGTTTPGEVAQEREDSVLEAKRGEKENGIDQRIAAAAERAADNPAERSMERE